MLDHLRTPARILVATLMGAALFVSAPAAAQDVHGAIAFGTETEQSNGVAYGFAWNFLAKDAAHAEAMKACISSGGTNCIQLAWFQDGCGALAMDQHGNAQGKPGMTREQAEARALRTCEAAGGAGCDIVGSLCTTPDGEPGTYSGSESVLPMQDAQTTVTGPTTDESPAHEEPAPLQDAQTVVAEPADESLAREDRITIQYALNAMGFDAGPADGIFGPRTLAAIYYWQRSSGHEATGYLTREQAEFLMAADATLDRQQAPATGQAERQALATEQAERQALATEQAGDGWTEFTCNFWPTGDDQWECRVDRFRNEWARQRHSMEPHEYIQNHACEGEISLGNSCTREADFVCTNEDDDYRITKHLIIPSSFPLGTEMSLPEVRSSLRSECENCSDCNVKRFEQRKSSSEIMRRFAAQSDFEGEVGRGESMLTCDTLQAGGSLCIEYEYRNANELLAAQDQCLRAGYAARLNASCPKGQGAAVCLHTTEDSEASTYDYEPDSSFASNCGATNGRYLGSR